MAIFLSMRRVCIWILLVHLIVVNGFLFKGNDVSDLKRQVTIITACFTFMGLGDANALSVPLSQPLKNQIILLRSGESYADQDNRIETNPVKKLAIANALTPQGREEIINAGKKLCSHETPSWIWTSNTERAYESATILARECQVGQNRIVPEFSLLDARGMGMYEGMHTKESYATVHENDEKQGVNWAPTSKDDVPSNSVNDIFVKLNQLLSTIDGMYSGEMIVIVSPDSECLSILQAGIVDKTPDDSLPKHSRFAFANGELRVLEPFVQPLTVGVTGKSQEQELEVNRKLKSLRFIDTTKSVNRKISNWFDLYE